MAKQRLTSMRPVLLRGARLHYDQVREKHMLLMPERVVILNEEAAAILALCDGQRTVADVAATLEAEYEAEGLLDDVTEFIADFIEKGWVK